MINLFKRKPKQRPDFLILNSYENKEKYFYRIAEWLWHNKNEITVIDPNQPRVITLDPWTQLVYLAADGQKTVSKFVDIMANEYTGEIPEKLDETIINQVEILLKEGIIKLSENPVKLDANILNAKK